MNKKQQNLAQYPKTQNPNQGFEQKIHNMVKTKKHPKLKLKISTKMLKVKSSAWSPNENRPKQGGYTITFPPYGNFRGVNKKFKIQLN
jgi:hypothetical protein